MLGASWIDGAVAAIDCIEVETGSTAVPLVIPQRPLFLTILYFILLKLIAAEKLLSGANNVIYNIQLCFAFMGLTGRSRKHVLQEQDPPPLLSNLKTLPLHEQIPLETHRP